MWIFFIPLLIFIISPVVRAYGCCVAQTPGPITMYIGQTWTADKCTRSFCITPPLHDEAILLPNCEMLTGNTWSVIYEPANSCSAGSLPLVKSQQGWVHFATNPYWFCSSTKQVVTKTLTLLKDLTVLLSKYRHWSRVLPRSNQLLKLRPRRPLVLDLDQRATRHS